jgi:Na+-driven multidrug efflux pump
LKIICWAQIVCKYAVIFVSFLFCFIGYFNGCGSTAFVMLQGLIGAFGVRIPVSWFMSRQTGVTLFKIGLATPCSTVIQILMCIVYFCRLRKKQKATL